MKLNKIKIALLALILTIFASDLSAQGRFDVGLDLKNMHYWRGLRVSDGFVAGPTVGYFNGGFAILSWGGMSLDGDFLEVTNIISYTTGGFTVALADIFNFSGLANPQYFNYNADETNHIIDLSVSYNFGENVPLRFMLATIIYGNDRDAMGNNRYSTYFEVGLPFQREGFTVEPYVALGLALSGDATNTLYGDRSFDMVNLGLAVSRNVKLGNFNLPVTTRLATNPSLNQASVEVAMKIF